jgi:hypothetical protein
MGMPILHVGAVVVCMHVGQAQPILRNPRVKVSGMNIVTTTCNYSISGCTLPPPPAGNGPCATATWVAGASRVKANGLPVILSTSPAVCVPTGTGLQVIFVQSRVTAI